MISCGDKNLVIAAVHSAHRSERRGYACGAAAEVHGKSNECGMCMCRVYSALRPMHRDAAVARAGRVARPMRGRGMRRLAAAAPCDRPRPVSSGQLTSTRALALCAECAHCERHQA